MERRIQASSQQQLEIALQQSEARFHRLAANTPGVIYQLRRCPNGEVSLPFISDRCKPVLEVEAAALQQDANLLICLIHQDDRAAFDRSLSLSATTLEPWRWEGRFMLPSGQVRWLETTAAPEAQENGNTLWDGWLIDVTDRKQTEAQLRESQEFLQLVMNNIPQSVFWKDCDSVHLGCNRNFARDAGMSIESIVGKTDYEMPWSREEAETYRLYDRQVMDSGTAELHIVETQHLADGTQIWIDISKVPLHDADGTVVGILGAYEDITDRKQMEFQLREAQEFLQLVMNTIPQSIFWKDGNSVYLGCNRNFERDAGLTSEKIIGKTDYEMPWSREEADSYRLHDRQVIESNTAQLHILETQQQADGRQIWVDTSKIPLHDAAGNVIGVLGTYEDITDRKQAEAALKQSEATNRALIAAMPDLLMRMSGEGTLLEILGRERLKLHDEQNLVIGCNIYDLLPPKPAQQRQFYIQQALQTGEVQCYEQQLVIDGQVVDEEIRISVTGANEVLAVVRDISDRKQAEANLREKEQFLRSIFEGASHGVFVLDVMDDDKFCYTALNPIAEETLGLETTGCCGKTPRDVFPAPVADMIYERLRSCAETGIPIINEDRLVFRGEERWHFTTITPVKNEAGKVYRLIGTAIDISDRKQAEATIAEQMCLTAFRADIDMALTRSGDLQTILKNCTEAIVNRLDAAFARIWTLNAAENMLELQASSGLYTHLDGGHARVPVGKFKIGWIAESRQPYLTNNVQTDPRVGDRAWAEREGMIAFAGYPLLVDGQLLGVVAMFARSPLSDSTFKALEFATDEISLGIKRIDAETALRQSEAQLQEKMQRDRLLNQLTDQIRSSLDCDTILEIAVREIRQLFQIERCHFGYYHATDAPYWDIIKENRIPDLPDLTGTYPAASLGVFAEKLLQLEMLRVDDVQAVEDQVWRELVCNHLNLCSVMVIPMKMRSGKLGVLSCSNTHSIRKWSDAEVALTAAVVEQLAIAIDQAELYKQSQTAAQIAEAKAAELEETLRELQRTQTQLVQSEKMSSLGQLVAGVAHEINNPVNFIYGNVLHAGEYTEDLLELLQLYQQHYPNPIASIQARSAEIDLNFLMEDLPNLLNSMKVGADRIQQIVRSLRNFSRMDEAEMKVVDIHEGIDSTLMILQNRLKEKSDNLGIEVIKQYGQLPTVECYAGQLNQVFMNILTNAIDALEERDQGRSREEIKQNPSQIWITTEAIGTSHARIRILDNGTGISEAVQHRLFDPFFTTKPVGKGTGLGMSISYQIVTEKHGGTLRCQSTLGEGAEFIIEIPLQQSPQ
jgi:PAS domain S-box-containing protein